MRRWELGPACLGSNPAPALISCVSLEKFFPARPGSRGALLMCWVLGSMFCANCLISWGFPGGSVVMNTPANAGDLGSIPGWGRSPGGRNGNLLQYSCLGNPIDRGDGKWISLCSLPCEDIRRQPFTNQEDSPHHTLDLLKT